MFKKVNEIVPSHLRLTSFSILIARYKRALELFGKGAKSINDLKTCDKVLIAEVCAHHAFILGNIACEKLPVLLEKKLVVNLNIINVTSADFPENLSYFKLIIHCGSCMLTRR